MSSIQKEATSCCSHSVAVFCTFLDIQTELILATLEKEEKSVAMDLILDTLTSPIHDQFDLKAIFNKVQQVAIADALKARVLENMKVAVDSMN